CYFVFFFFQAEDGIRDLIVTGVQTCALPIYHAAGVQPQRRVVGRRMYGGMQTHMPLRLNTGGVIPVIFASSVLAFPLTLMQWVGYQDKPWLASLYRQLDYAMPLHNLLYFVAIIFFCYFYISIIFNPMDVA